MPLARDFDPIGFAVLVAVTLGAAVGMERFGSPNSWMIGPLLAAAVITATGHTFSALPVAVVNARSVADRHFTGHPLHPRVLPCRAAVFLPSWP